MRTNVILLGWNVPAFFWHLSKQILFVKSYIDGEEAFKIRTHTKNVKKGHFSNPVKESAIVGHSAFFNTLFFGPNVCPLFFCSPFEDGKARMFVDESNFPEADSSFNRIRKQTFDQSKAHSKVGIQNMDFYAPQKLREIKW